MNAVTCRRTATREKYRSHAHIRHILCAYCVGDMNEQVTSRAVTKTSDGPYVRDIAAHATTQKTLKTKRRGQF